MLINNKYWIIIIGHAYRITEFKVHLNFNNLNITIWRINIPIPFVAIQSIKIFNKALIVRSVLRSKSSKIYLSEKNISDYFLKRLLRASLITVFSQHFSFLDASIFFQINILVL